MAPAPSLEALSAQIQEQDTRVRVVEQLVGRAPTALPGDKGSGLAQYFVDLTQAVEALRVELTQAVEALRENVEAERRERAAEAARTASRRAPWGRAAWIAMNAVIAAATGALTAGGLHWLVTLHH